MEGGFRERLRSFFGYRGPNVQQPPNNEFRNPIWGSDDDDDDDELYTRHNMGIGTPFDFHRELTKHMQDMFRTFGGIFGDMKIFHDPNDDFMHIDSFTNTPTNRLDMIPDSESFDSNKIRDFYLKPGYHKSKSPEPKDIDLDGKISSKDISGLLTRKDEGPGVIIKPFDGNLVQGVPFCQTIITTSVKKPDGTVETRRIVKRGNEVIEETTSTSEPSGRGPTPGLTSMSYSTSTDIFLSDLASLFKNFY